MANDTTTAQAGQDQVPPVTWGERLAGVAGVITATAILLICLDLTLGGALSSKVSRKASAWSAAGIGVSGEDGGCGC